jgi:hypothetical protein
MNDQIAHRGIVAGREVLRNYRRNNNSPWTGTPTEKKVRLTIRLEAQALAHTIECRFVRTGKIELPEGQIEAPAKSTS